MLVPGQLAAAVHRAFVFPAQPRPSAGRVPAGPVNLAENEPVEPGDPLSFHVIYASWFEQVSQWVRALGGPEADREDLVQDVFMVVHRRLPDFDGDNLPGWLYQIARRRVRDFRRLAWVKHFVFGSASHPENIVNGDTSAADLVETQQKAAILERLLGRLNESERVALVLFEVEGYSGAQIAHLQGVSINTVWGRIYKARKKLKSWLGRIDHGVYARKF